MGGGCPPARLKPSAHRTGHRQELGVSALPIRPPASALPHRHIGRVSVSPSAEAPTGEEWGVQDGKGSLEVQVAYPTPPPTPAGDRRRKGVRTGPRR